MSEFERQRIAREQVQKVEERFDAIRAIEYLRQKQRRSYKWAAEILAALGLLDEDPSSDRKFRSNWD